MLLAEEGVPLALIDKAATDFGMPMGPIELTDVVGLDVAMHVGKILADAFGKPTPPDRAVAGRAEEARQEDRPGVLCLAGRQARQAAGRRRQAAG